MPGHLRSPLAPARFPELPEIAGARFAVGEAGIRYRGRPDLALAALDPGTTVAGVFTRSQVPGHPVLWCRRILPRGRARALVVNAGNANVFRGREGDEAVRLEAQSVAELLGCRPEDVFVASTGVIGERLPVEKITAILPDLARNLRADSLAAVARAIMTTDTFPKAAVRSCAMGGHRLRLVGIAKGSGMIAPQMATMLAFLFTDAAIPAPVLQALLVSACEPSFNAITVDGDTSTSDTLLLFATGRAGNAPPASPEAPELAGFREALLDLCVDLATQVVRDGEGAQKFITIEVTGAIDAASARRIGLTIANSPLVKTAIAGEDANWGRVVAAVGRANEPVDLGRLSVAFGGHWVARDGGAVPGLDEAPIAAHLRGREIHITVVVGDGPGQARVWTCDLTHGYIDINGSYRS